MSLFNGKLNSDYFKAYALGKYVTVFVEGDDDIPFWERIFKTGSSSSLRFEVKTASREGLAKGKTALLKHVKDGVGDFLLICVDSDYDYLLQDATPNSTAINHSLYIFQTYTHSIENYKCFAESLAAICAQASLNDEPAFDIPAFLQTYSETVYDLFLWTFYFVKIGETKIFTGHKFSVSFGIPGKVNIDDMDIVIQQFQANVKQKTREFHTLHPYIDLQQIASDIAKLGVTRENVYLFIKGHLVYDNLVLPLLKNIVARLRSHKQAEFVRQAAGNQEILCQKQQEYDGQTQNIETLLASNTGYETCMFMQSIRRDIDHYVNLSRPAHPR